LEPRCAQFKMIGRGRTRELVRWPTLPSPRPPGATRTIFKYLTGFARMGHSTAGWFCQLRPTPGWSCRTSGQAVNRSGQSRRRTGLASPFWLLVRPRHVRDRAISRPCHARSSEWRRAAVARHYQAFQASQVWRWPAFVTSGTLMARSRARLGNASGTPRPQTEVARNGQSPSTSTQRT
jgi:hypothetical protein